MVFMDKHAKTYRVAVDDNENVIGFIGHVSGDVRLATDSSILCSGVGRFMWSAFSQEFPDLTVKVKRDNERSMSFFKKLGWAPKQEHWDAGADPVALLPP